MTAPVVGESELQPDAVRRDVERIAEVPADAIADRDAVTAVGATLAATDVTERSVEDQRALASTLAWADRAAGRPFYDDLVDAGPRMFLLVAQCSRLRYDFRFTTMDDLLERYDGDVRGDAMLLAMRAYARFGLRAPDASQRLDEALEGDHCDDAVRDVVLHALWLSFDDPSNAERALAIADEVEDQDDPNAHFRRAAAFRALGRYEDGLAAIARCFEALGPGATQAHQDYTRERELIILAMQQSGR